MKKFYITSLFLILIAGLILSGLNSFAADSKKVKKLYTVREYSTTTKDNHIIKSYLSYPKTKQKSYPGVIMLHSFGYNSSYWQNLQEEFNNNGYAVLRIDLRGHGKSVYDSSFHQRSWRVFKNDTFAKYPDDVMQVTENVQTETKKFDFNNYIIIGADIGANTSVLFAEKNKIKPKAMVLISPSMTFKGLYIPIALAELDKTPILGICSKTNKKDADELIKLSKFAQNTYDVLYTDKGSSGMLLLKQYNNLNSKIFNWCTKYLKK